MINKRRGIVPVLAVVILIAVAVALGIAIAFWASGLIGTLGNVEKLEIRTIYAEKTNNGWNITISGENTGTSDITIVEITVNGVPLSSYTSGSAEFTVGTSTYTYSNGITVPIPSGQSFTATVYIEDRFTSGQTVEIGLVTGSGVVFKRTTTLP